ncbi:MAG TPA: prolyl oligopeptidase family serine peptidase [Ktedonobacterales bacterium]|nr:prolyl oligopeptidase family serine peptidase [Ktedonobacterales bacterium]
MANPPRARVEIVRDEYFGRVIEDPYRWMENYKDEEAQAWLHQQADHAAQVLGALPERDALLARITELSDAGPEMRNLSVAGGRVFALRQNPGENLPRLVMYTAPDAPETTLLDPNAMSGETHTAIDWFAPSCDGRLVAYGVSQGGSEDSTLHVLDIDQGTTLDLAIPHVRFGGVCWLEDNASFLYNRLPDPSPGAPPGDYYLDSRVQLHRLGADPASDPVVLGRGAHAGVNLDRIDIPFVVARPDSPWMVGLVLHGDLKENLVYVAPTSALADPATIPWRRVASPDDAVTGFAFTGNTLYLLTHHNAPRYQVIALPLNAQVAPDLAQAMVVVPESEAVLQDICVAGEYLLVREMKAGIGGLRRVPLAGGAPEAVSLPDTGAILDWAGEPGSNVVYLATTAWTAAPRSLRYDAVSNTASDTGWLPPSSVDFSEIEAHEVEAPAPDDERIPLSIIHRKGLARDGSHPTLLIGYGSYGISLPPFFMPQMLAWYERGGVMAVAHMRGGGEKGDEWHQTGRLLNKENTIGDFIACAEYLVSEGYTRPGLLAGEGGSAGGIPSGGALVRRPDLFAAMVMRVAITNALRAELTENGPPNVMEFGSATTEDGFNGLLIIDSYLRVRDGTAYPAVLLTSGANDPRVVVWMAMKMAARLQVATSSDKPILLRLEEQGGHGMGSTRQQEDAELADKLAFLLWQFGLTGRPATE